LPAAVGPGRAGAFGVGGGEFRLFLRQQFLQDFPLVLVRFRSQEPFVMLDVQMGHGTVHGSGHPS
jgi:hypothetical protein